MICRAGDKTPEIHGTAYVAPTAVVIGDVELQANTSVWFGVILRGDAGKITIGEGTNVQDGAIIHEETQLGKSCVVGHGAVIDGCKLGDGVLVGIGAVVFGGAQIGDGAVIAAGAVVPPGTVVPPNTLVRGVPAAPAGEVTEGVRQMTRQIVNNYMVRSREYCREGWLVAPEDDEASHS